MLIAFPEKGYNLEKKKQNGRLENGYSIRETAENIDRKKTSIKFPKIEEMKRKKREREEEGQRLR